MFWGQKEKWKRQREVCVSGGGIFYVCELSLGFASETLQEPKSEGEMTPKPQKGLLIFIGEGKVPASHIHPDGTEILGCLPFSSV